MCYILCFTFFGGPFVVTRCKPTWFFLLYLKIGVKQLITTVSVLAAGTHWNNRLGSTCHCNLFSGLLWWNPQSFYFLDNKKRPAMQRTPFMKYLPLVHNELQRNPSSKLGSPPSPPKEGDPAFAAYYSCYRKVVRICHFSFLGTPSLRPCVMPPTTTKDFDRTAHP